MVLRRQVEKLWADSEDVATGDMAQDERRVLLHGLERVEGNVAAGTDPASADQPTGTQVGRGTRVGVAMRWGPPCRNTGNAPDAAWRH
ncbi:hypothetical protein [Streptomyces sp. NPDC059744]|uniref:hypothetical protein n=1 Tax=Streptomyces sp. NPDC059744 TaxID=3346929 RepID=UPI003660ABB8